MSQAGHGRTDLTESQGRYFQTQLPVGYLWLLERTHEACSRPRGRQVAGTGLPAGLGGGRNQAPLLPFCGPSPAPLLPLCGPSPGPLWPLCGPSAAPLRPLCSPSPAPLWPLCSPSPAPLWPLSSLSVAPLQQYRDCLVLPTRTPTGTKHRMWVSHATPAGCEAFLNDNSCSRSAPSSGAPPHR